MQISLTSNNENQEQKVRSVLGAKTQLSPENIKSGIEYIKNFNSNPSEILPTVQGLALHLGRTVRTLASWRDYDEKAQEDMAGYPEIYFETESGPIFFSDVYDMVKSHQTLKVLMGGLNKDYDSGICKLLLLCNGYDEKQTMVLTDPDGGSVANVSNTYIIEGVDESSE